MNELINWVVAFMIAVASQHGDFSTHDVPQEQAELYHEAATDLVEVVFDKNERSLYPDEKYGRTHTVAILLGIMRHESGFDPAIDDGSWRGDSGESWCWLQVRAGRFGRTRPWNRVHDRPPYWGDLESEIFLGATGREMIEDRKLCFDEGLRIARWSFSRCGNRGPFEQLRVYASGDCASGGEASRARLWSGEQLFQQWEKEGIPWENDDQLVQELLVTTLVEQAAQQLIYGQDFSHPGLELVIQF